MAGILNNSTVKIQIRKIQGQKLHKLEQTPRPLSQLGVKSAMMFNSEYAFDQRWRKGTLSEQI